MAKKNIDIFGSAKPSGGTGGKKSDKLTVQESGFESKLLELDALKAQIADLEAQYGSVYDEIRQLAKEKFIELYEENGKNPNTFYIRDGEGCVMVIPTDRYITIKEDRAFDLIRKYGKSLVTIDEKFYFNNEVLERNMEAIQKLIANSRQISDNDKMNLLNKEVKYSVKKGTIDTLTTYDDITEVVDDIQPVITLKNCGNMADGGSVGEQFIGYIYE